MSLKRTKGSLLTCGVALMAATMFAVPAHAFTWTAAPVNPGTGGNAFGLWLLTDGRVLSHGSALNNWVVLTPDKTGSYANGTWKSVASSQHARGGAQQHVLNDGRFFQAGGEFIDGPACTNALCPTTEIYDPVANTWTATATAPMDIGDTGSATLADGRILDSTRNGSGIQIYDPKTNTWSVGSNSVLSTGDENAWAALQNGAILAVGFSGGGAALYNPATSKWIRTGPVPTGFNTGDTGGITQMFDGRVFVYGLNTKSYIYTPGATPADPGTWATGPTMLDNEAEDEFSDILPNGMVLGALVNVMFGPGTILQQFDPNTNTVSSFTPPPDRGNPFPIGYCNLPNGQVMVTAAARNWILTPDGAPNDAWRPTVTSVTFNSAQNNYTLTGTQISGLVNGSDEGDDMTNQQNYPIVWLTDNSGNVFYCRTFNISNMTPSKGSTPETCQFTTPAGLPAGSYNLFVSAVGVQSKNPFPFTVGQSTTTGAGGTSGGTGGAGGGGAGGTSGGAGGAGGASGGAGGTTATGAGGNGSMGTGGAKADGGAGTTGTTTGGGGATTTTGGGGATATTGGGGSSGKGEGGAGAGPGVTTGTGGCNCVMAGASSGGGLGGLLFLAGLTTVIARRRRLRR
jgi:MYXO-CTERM domain-containing protein